MALHASQVLGVDGAYTPEPDRIAWAQCVLDARAAADEDRGMFAIDGEMIDAPLVA